MRKGGISEPATDQSLRALVNAIIGNDVELFSKLMNTSTALTTTAFSEGASRQQSPGSYFLAEIGHYINSGDTALHFAAASYRPDMAERLIEAGADVRARNRRGCEPLHSAAVGNPDSPRWNPAAQAATIGRLIEAGADPNAMNMDGTTPLHRAVRTRSAAAVQALLKHGADPAIRTKNGSTAVKLALSTTGRGGSGSPEAKAQQRQIVRLLGER